MGENALPLPLALQYLKYQVMLSIIIVTMVSNIFIIINNQLDIRMDIFHLFVSRLS